MWARCSSTLCTWPIWPSTASRQTTRQHLAAPAHSQGQGRLVDAGGQLPLAHAPLQRGLSGRPDAQGGQVGRLARCAFCHPGCHQIRRSALDPGSRSSFRASFTNCTSCIESGPCSSCASTTARPMAQCQLCAAQAHHERPVRPFFQNGRAYPSDAQDFFNKF
jgi:hypothetical protein